MARLARVVVSGFPHHVIQRGNRRQRVFFSDGDRQEYLRVLREQGDRFGIRFWAYCLMDNHVHLVAVPEAEESLAHGIGEAHRRYTRRVHFREGWRGYLWQGRFSSYPMDERYLYAAVRYVERNPVRAKRVERAEDYPWSSARAHVKGIADSLITPCFLVSEIQDWASYLRDPEDEKDLKEIEGRHRTGRPWMESSLLEDLERRLGRPLLPKAPGPKPRKGL